MPQNKANQDMLSRRVKASIIAVALSSVIIVSVFILTLPLNPLDPDNPDTPDNPEPSVPDLDISEKTNLIPNAGFELGEYSSSGIPESWDYYEGNAEYEWVNDSAQAHTGSKCIRLENAWNEDRPEDRPSLYSYVTPPEGIGIENRRFLMHMWTRIDNVSTGSVWLVVRYRIGSSTIDYDIFRCQNSTEWSSNDFVLETIPADTTAFRIDLMLDNAPGAVWFDDVFLVELNSTEYEAVSQVGRFSPLNWSGSTPAGTSSEATHLEQIEGAWWLVNSSGHSFWSVGVSSDGVNPQMNPYLWENLGSPDEAGIQAYKGECRVRLKQDLNCNTAYRDTPEGPSRNYVSWMNFGTEITTVNGSTPSWILRDHNGVTFGGYGAHQFPDPFDPDWQSFVHLVADAGMPEWLLAYPDVLGYWTDNEMEYGPLYRYIYGESCSRVFTEWLQGNLSSCAPGAEPSSNQVHADIVELNAAWSSSWHTYAYSSWDDLVSGSDPVRIRGWNDSRVMDDMYAFEREIYRAYCHNVINAIRKAEDVHSTPHKLIILSRIAYPGPGYYADCLKRVMDLFSNFDIIGLNLYPDYNRMRTHYLREYLEDLEDIFVTRTGRPIIVAEFGLGGVDSGVPVARWRPKTVDTQEQRGIGYRNLVNQLFHLPYIVGAHWYMWSNAYYSGGYSDPRNSGVVDDSDDYYISLKIHMASTNWHVNSAYRSGTMSINDFYWHSLQVTVHDGT